MDHIEEKQMLNIYETFAFKYISKIEMVQRRAARWTFGNFDNRASVTEMLNKLAVPAVWGL